MATVGVKGLSLRWVNRPQSHRSLYCRTESKTICLLRWSRWQDSYNTSTVSYSIIIPVSLTQARLFSKTKTGHFKTKTCGARA